MKTYLRARASSKVTHSITKIPALYFSRQRRQRFVAREVACMTHARSFWLPARNALHGCLLLSLEPESAQVLSFELKSTPGH